MTFGEWATNGLILYTVVFVVGLAISAWRL